MTQQQSRPWDPFWLAFFRLSRRLTRLSPGARGAASERSQMQGLLGGLGHRRPVLAGVLAVPLWGGAMMIFFDLITGFRSVETMAWIWGIAGCIFGTAMGWYWSYTKRTGAPPQY